MAHSSIVVRTSSVIGLICALSVWSGQEVTAQTEFGIQPRAVYYYGAPNWTFGPSWAAVPGWSTGAFSRGFTLDPYTSGRFRAPDLHDDAEFRYRTKFNSRYPGRRNSGLAPVPYNPYTQSYGFPIGR